MRLCFFILVRHGKYFINVTIPSSEEQEKDLADDAKELEGMEAGISFKSVFDFMTITAPSRLAGKSVGTWLDEIRWSDQRKGKELEAFWKQGKQYQFCSKPGLKRVILAVCNNLIYSRGNKKII